MINPKIVISAETLSTNYNAAQEFPHIVFDDFVDPSILKDVSVEAQMVLDEDTETRDWRFGINEADHNDQILKKGIRDLNKMTPSMNLLCRYFNDDSFMIFLRKLTGIEGLVPDWGFEGGGLHVTSPGGLLGIHHDFNFKDDMHETRMYRKINLLVYLNEDWEDEWDGALELWKSDLTGDFKVIQPKYGRAVLFNIEDAPHGHPRPLKCPEGETRRSLAFYYYDKIPPANGLFERAHWKYGKELL